MEIGKSEAKKTLIVGATTNPSRYAYLAAKMFAERGIEFIPIGIKKGELFGREILDLRAKPDLKDIHTITLYIGPNHQEEWIEYLISLNRSGSFSTPAPKTLIFSTLQKRRALRSCPPAIW